VGRQISLFQRGMRIAGEKDEKLTRDGVPLRGV
jgi:hypothetical protein